MILRRAAWIGLVLAPVIVIAAPTTRPAPGTKARPMVDRPALRESRDANWDDALKFFKQHSPNRAAAWEAMKEPRKTRYKGLILDRYYSVRSATREDDDQLRQIKIKQVEIEDRIFAIKSQLVGDNLPSADAEPLKKDLRDKIRELVEMRMGERKERIARMESLLKAEKERLQNDEARREQMIEAQYRAVLNAQTPELAGDRLRRRDAERDSAKSAKGR